MAKHLTASQLCKILQSNTFDSIDKFALLKNIAIQVNSNHYLAQELVLRLLERRNEFDNYTYLIESLIRQVGLFPYLNSELLNLSDSIAYESHKPRGLRSKNIVFHRMQAIIYYELLKGENVILSAPTSFGKSLIIDAIISSNKYKNLAIILPTIALIDETRKRLSYFRDIYKIITHSNQEKSDKNIFILTQERVPETIGNVKIDFFVIDEFYKINISEENDNRAFLLNKVFYFLSKSGAQFYLLGPNIERISDVFPGNIKYKFIRTDYKTVVSEEIKIKTKKDEDKYNVLCDLCFELKGQTLIYCQSPSSANKVTASLINSGLFNKTHDNFGISKWLKDNYHPAWLLPSALEFGIGIHHGKIPRAISQYCVKSFNANKLNFLVCTSTLIEGVNTKAKNVIIFDNKIAKKKFDYFTFNNISGRSGRMFEHFIGKVFLFHEPPEPELPFVDFPIFSQTEEVPEELLIHVDDDDLTDASYKRLEKYFDQDILSVDVLKENSYVNLEQQLELAKELIASSSYYSAMLNWKIYPPTYDHLILLCKLIWDYLIPQSGKIYGISSANQLAFRLKQFQANPNIRDFITKEVNQERNIEKANKSIETALDILRHWFSFSFPRLLMTLNNIQMDVFSKISLPFGNFSFYASKIESYFTDTTLIALDEFGIPFQVSQKLIKDLKPNGNLDDVINRLKMLNFENSSLTKIEKEFIIDAKQYL